MIYILLKSIRILSMSENDYSIYRFSGSFSFKMKEIFKKDDNAKQEENGPTETVSFLSLVCHLSFRIEENKRRVFLVSLRE